MSGAIPDEDETISVNGGQGAVSTAADVTDHGAKGERRPTGNGADLLSPRERPVIAYGVHRPAEVRTLVQRRGAKLGQRSGRCQPVGTGVRGDEPVIAETGELVYRAADTRADRFTGIRTDRTAVIRVS